MKRLAEESHHIREKNRLLSISNIKWDRFPQKLFIVHKETDLEFIKEKLEELVRWLLDHWQSNSESLDLIGIYPSVLEDTLTSQSEKLEFYKDSKSIPTDIDLVFTLGGDGTVLLAAWLFQDHAPPIAPFHFGTLGFLTIFNWESFSARISSILTSGSRNEAISSYNVLNEIVVERGASPFMSILDIFGENKFLTKIQADGVAIATPTGSTAYSLSAGGSVVHPDVNAILVTPICPHSLSFRPLIVPENLELKIVVSDSNRGNVWVSFDGRARIELEPGDFLIVRPSTSPVITLCRDNQTSDWFHSLSQCLHWNKR